MTERRPLVIKDGQIQQLQYGDSICTRCSDVPLISGGNAIDKPNTIICGGTASSVATHILNGGSA